MVRLTVTSSLARLLAGGDGGLTSRKSVTLHATSWRELTEEMHSRFPVLARRVLAGDGTVTPGFLFVVNDVVIHQPDESFRLGSNDELYLVAAVAGGCQQPTKKGVNRV